MRVLELKPVQKHSMGKKKHKLRKHSKENASFPTDSSDEAHQGATGERCPHLNKSININTLRKALKQLGTFGTCTSCSRDGPAARKSQDGTEESNGVKSEPLEDSFLELAEPVIWVCLQCGHQGCDRNSKEKHALKHYQTPRSASHAVAVNTSTWVVWCYDCDDECALESSRKLTESVEFLRRIAAGDYTLTLTSGRNSTSIRPESTVPISEFDVDASTVREKDDKDNSKQQNRPKSVTSNPFSGIPLPKVQGLSNLGNTCFFNAVMQNLSHTYILRRLLGDHCDRGVSVTIPGQQCSSDSEDTASSSGGEDEKDEKISMEPLTITMPESGSLTRSLFCFLGDMGVTQGVLRPTSNGIINPSRLFGQICKKTPRFKGFQQQDSHELLRHLLDGLKAEEIKRSQTGILKAFNLEHANPRKVDDETKLKIKEYGRQVKHTFVDSVFGGYFISTVLCEECHMPSQIFEPFQDVSLPITEEKPTRPNNLAGSRKKNESCDTVPTSEKLVEKASKGVEGFAAPNKPSKHLTRKAKKQAKRDAKKKAKKTNDHGQTDKDKVSIDEENDEEEEDKNEDGVERETEEQEEQSEHNCSQDKDTTAVSEDWEQSDADVEDNIESDASRKRAATLGSTDRADLSVNGRISPPCGEVTGDVEKCLTPTPAEIASHNASNRTNTKSPVTLEGDRDCVSLEHNSQSKDSEKLTEISEGLRTLMLNDNKMLEREKGNQSPSTGRETPMHNSVVVNGPTESAAADTADGDRTSPRPKSPKSKHKKRDDCREIQLRALNTLAPRNQPAPHECSIMSCLNQFTAGELLTGNNKFGCERCTLHKHGKRTAEGKKETVYTNASKQLLIFVPPAVLTLHLKRFQQVGFSLRKVNRHVDFPLELDLAPYCSALCQGIEPNQTSIRYSLYGVVEHTGRLNAGHYTAYVKVRPDTGELKHFLQLQDINGFKLHKVLEMLKSLNGMGNDRGPEKGDMDANEENEGVASVGKWYYMSDTRVSETSEAAVLRCQAYLLFYERLF